MGRTASRRETPVVPADEAGIARAAKILRAGGLVAFPTETVYGLGANALEAAAARRIFAAKRRPADDPLIVHVASLADVPTVATLVPMAEVLAQRCWPGPLTLVLPKLARVPPEVSAGLETVAVRVPSHPVAQALLQATSLPIAAPSANLFGRSSPTRAAHVLADLGGRIDLILDGGPTTVGLESTIVDLSGAAPRLLRPGGLAAEKIEAILGISLLPPPPSTPGPQPGPGLLPRHYAPRTPLVLVTGAPPAARTRLHAEVEAALAAGQRVGALLLTEDVGLLPREVCAEVVGAYAEPGPTAAHLFAALRALDARDLDVLFARDLAAPSGLGRALADRLRRAAGRVVDSDT